MEARVSCILFVIAGDLFVFLRLSLLRAKSGRKRAQTNPTVEGGSDDLHTYIQATSGTARYVR